ncbi:MAG: 16S rRNA (adenine(1518)-N(6)/adenine(1519)-N(6))-dimethyltransferase RsmA, partial [Acidobacteriota bacterium]
MSPFITPQQYFREHEGRPKKSFGQNFLIQPKTAENIVKAAELDPSEVAIEVGPGLGALTRFILPEVRRLHLVELDRDMIGYLKESVSEFDCEVTIHQKDVLHFDFEAISRSEGQPLVLLGNLPYNISSPLVFRLLEARSIIKRAVFMVQKEVGERFAAAPGGGEYGVLSVLLGVYARVSRLYAVGPGQFYPPPKVDSLVVRIDFEPAIEDAPPFPFLRSLVNAAFQQRRKTLQNSLRGFVKNAELLERVLSQNGIDPKRRPETLSPEEFSRLASDLLG